MNVPLRTTDFLDRGVDLYDDVTAVVTDEGREFTYDEFAERVNQVSNALLDAGLERGDRVALVAGNTHYFLETEFATQQLGMVFVPINYRLTPGDYEYILNDCEARVVIADHEFAEKVEAVRDDVPASRFVGYESDRIDGDWEDYETWVSDYPTDGPERPVIAEDDDATINYTSGTTGDPKGVVRTHRTEHYHALLLTHHMDISDDDTYLWTLPMFHCNGWGYTYALTGVGATHVCQRGFDPGRTFERMVERDVSHLCGAPTVLNRLITYYEEHEPETTGESDVRLTTAGSAPPKATLQTVEEEFGWEMIQLYGLTETAPLITTSNSARRLGETDDRFGLKQKQGFGVLATRIRVVDDDGEDVPPDGTTKGEVVVKGNQVMDRYLNKPEQTEDAFSGRVDGWFHTGDIATVDENGMIQIQDRKKDIIITGGENVSSIEVEDVLYDHPDVLKAAVVAAPDDEWGERVHGVVVEQDDADLSEEEVIDFAADHLASYKKPRSIDFVDDLPETATGKVQKYELRERYWEGEETRVGQG
ncbi:long-chain-fatty-acid--CoA ligase [Halosimplex salinum]|uniref:long-chain-fatty-acid--CoA ligase n=1 Tax=Halosimplex salinum TaxID=1710538 RepID=UPI000F4816A5|nr:long-chain-fatty-acid--CoA ligase [Halosimplex salinum]